MSMHYDEITEGDQVPEHTVTDVRGEHMQIVAAIIGDPNPIHFDLRQIKEMGHKGLVNQGGVTMSYATQALLKLVDSPAALKSMNARMLDNVYEGETVTVRGTVTEKAGEGIVHIDIQVETDDERVVLDGSGSVYLETG